MKTYVIVVTYNGVHWLEKCFGSLVNTNTPLKILAIDNASTDGTPEQIKKQFPQVELIETGANLGFGKANNIGLIKAMENSADYVFLLNQDAWVEPDTIEKLIEVNQNRPEFGILSPIHMNGQGTALDINFAFCIRPSGCPNLISDIITKNLNAVYETRYVNAAAWLLSNKCLTKVGGFDPIFPHYGEDDDYLNRTLYHGLKIGIVPHTRIYHDRVCKPFNQFELDQKRLLISNIVQLKAYPNSFKFNVLMLIKDQIDLLTSLLLLRETGKFNARLKALIKTLLMINRIKKAKEYFSNEYTIILPPENNDPLP
ncbi:MAG: glycosyltransferase family 2 protein [Methylovulum sp.]|nr:glycosyltransferase family 2 protein [Methylovulum sp.]